MKRTRQKIKSTNQKKSRLHGGSLVVLLFVLGVAGSSGWQLWNLHTQVEDQLTSLNQKKESLIQEQKHLHEEITLLNTPSYIEQLAREQLGLVKHGEILISPKN